MKTTIPAPSPQAGQLPFTGSPLEILLAAALTFAAVGTALVRVVRRKESL